MKHSIITLRERNVRRCPSTDIRVVVIEGECCIDFGRVSRPCKGRMQTLADPTFHDMSTRVSWSSPGTVGALRLYDLEGVTPDGRFGRNRSAQRLELRLGSWRERPCSLRCQSGDRNRQRRVS